MQQHVFHALSRVGLASAPRVQHRAVVSISHVEPCDCRPALVQASRQQHRSRYQLRGLEHLGGELADRLYARARERVGGRARGVRVEREVEVARGHPGELQVLARHLVLLQLLQLCAARPPPRALVARGRASPDPRRRFPTVLRALQLALGPLHLLFLLLQVRQRRLQRLLQRCLVGRALGACDLLRHRRHLLFELVDALLVLVLALLPQGLARIHLERVLEPPDLLALHARLLPQEVRQLLVGRRQDPDVDAAAVARRQPRPHERALALPPAHAAHGLGVDLGVVFLRQPPDGPDEAARHVGLLQRLEVDAVLRAPPRVGRERDHCLVLLSLEGLLELARGLGVERAPATVVVVLPRDQLPYIPRVQRYLDGGRRSQVPSSLVDRLASALRNRGECAGVLALGRRLGQPVGVAAGAGGGRLVGRRDRQRALRWDVHVGFM
mmetsp:Transcript_58468/g.137289  ORF Transcript_58468/g.137289 Transcript_58468/m.137289 type:complete len:441 (-) Transcript_58468:2037-3359(-)